MGPRLSSGAWVISQVSGEHYVNGRTPMTPRLLFLTMKNICWIPALINDNFTYLPSPNECGICFLLSDISFLLLLCSTTRRIYLLSTLHSKTSREVKFNLFIITSQIFTVTATYERNETKKHR